LSEIIKNKLKDKGIDSITYQENILKKIKERLNRENISEGQPSDTDNEIKNDEYLQKNIQTGQTQETGSDIKNTDSELDNNEKAQFIPIKNPESKFVAEIPEFVKDKEPGKIIIFDNNDIQLGAESLANKYFMTFENPDKKETIKNFWQKEGKLKTEVYLAKFEKTGEITYDYKLGIAKFEPILNNYPVLSAQTDFATTVSTPEEIQTIESIIKEILLDILKKSLL